ncbi:MAG: 3-oxoacyl-ACP reductase FabG [Victivallales bacterium]|jgi:3-oxoacyl-[acyl-carrier protein] reductase
MKTALIIGASRGIGRKIALRLASDGYDVVATCSKDISALGPLECDVRNLGRNFSGLAFDIRDRKASSEALSGFFGDKAPDILIYNAGIARDNVMVFMSPGEWDDVIHTNLDGFYNTVHPLLFPMISRKSGRIIAIVSASGQVGQAGQVNYSASKAALIGAVKALAKEVGKRGILVNAVAPGFIETDMTAGIPTDKILPMIPLNRVGTADDVAGAVSFLCGSDSSYIHGQVIAINGGLVI